MPPKVVSRVALLASNPTEYAPDAAVFTCEAACAGVARSAAQLSLLTLKPKGERCVGARLESHLSRTLPSSAPLATPRPISGVVAGSGDGTGSCAIVNGAHRVVRWCEVTVNPHPRFFVAWNFAFSVGRHSILVGVLWTKRAK